MIAYRVSDPLPTGETVRKADRQISKRERGECDECDRLADGEDSLCLFCREEK